MQVICTDGTVFRCQGYDITEYGLKLFANPASEEEDRYASDPEQIGFVPHDRLLYVLPDGVVPGYAARGGQVSPAPARSADDQASAAQPPSSTVQASTSAAPSATTPAAAARPNATR